MTRIGLWTRRALFSTISGIILTILMRTTADMVSDGPGGFPGASFTYSFGVVERNGAFWSVQQMRNAYFTDVDAKPFTTRAQAEAWRDRSQKLVESILRSRVVQRAGRIDSEFALPAWE